MMQCNDYIQAYHSKLGWHWYTKMNLEIYAIDAKTRNRAKLPLNFEYIKINYNKSTKENKKVIDLHAQILN